MARPRSSTWYVNQSRPIFYTMLYAKHIQGSPSQRQRSHLTKARLVNEYFNEYFTKDFNAYFTKDTTNMPKTIPNTYNLQYATDTGGLNTCCLLR